MEPTNKPPVTLVYRFKLLLARLLGFFKRKPKPAKKPVAAPKPKPAAKKEKSPRKKWFGGNKQTAVEFLPDAEEIERTPIPPYLRITLHTLLAVFISFLLWATFSEIDQIVTARGKLTTSQPNVVIQPLETAVVERIYVKTGQLVQKGELIATLDPTFTAADEAQLSLQLKSVENQVMRLEAELNGEVIFDEEGAPDADSELQARLSVERRASFNAQSVKLDESIAKLRTTLKSSEQDEQALTARVKVLREMEAMQQELVEKKLAPRSRLLDAEDRRIEAQRSMELAHNRQQEIRRELAALEAEKRSFETGWRQKMMEELLGVTRERDSLREQLQKARLRHEMVELRAPSEAVVLEVAKLSKGSVVQSGEKLVVLVPLAGDLEAEVQVNSMDVGYIKVADRAKVKLDAYPFQKHGGIEGEIRVISEDAFHRDESGQDAYYLTRVNLKSQKLDNMPEKTRLLPGMTLNAEIVVGKRSVMSYILWPLTKAMDESMREP